MAPPLKKFVLPAVLAISSIAAIASLYYHKDSILSKQTSNDEVTDACEKPLITESDQKTKKITVLISGSGSNLQAIIDAIDTKTLSNAEINKVISSSKKAYGLTRASDKNIPTEVHSLYTYTKGLSKEAVAERKAARELFELELADLILKDKPDIVVCAGWLLILGPTFLSRLGNAVPIINLHPALPGAFDGTVHAIDMAYEKAKELQKPFTAGCMVHYVIEDVDKGEPIIVKKLTIDTSKETLEQYEERLHATEHVAIVEATAKVLSN
ncbi:Phosphoribosylglycinamide formyltransferase [Hanseniaspora vineae]